MDWTLPGLLIIVILAGAARYVNPYLLSDLHPWPDTIEYVVSARSLIERGTDTVRLDTLFLPNEWTIGFPLLITPVFLALGQNYSNAVFTVLAADLALIVLVFCLARMLFGKPAGLLSAAIVALSPFDRSMSQFIMSDVPTTTFVIGSVVSVAAARSGLDPLRGAELRSRWGMVCLSVGGVLLGYSILIRQTSVAYIPAFVFFLLLTGFRREGNWRRNLSYAAASIAVFMGWVLTFQLLLILHNWQTFGSPTSSGFTYWLPDRFADPRRTFSLEYAFGPLSNAQHYLAALLGHHEVDPLTGQSVVLYPLVAVVLAAVTVLLAGADLMQTQSVSRAVESVRWIQKFRPQGYIPLQTSFAVLAVALVVTTYVIYASYMFYDLRFLHLSIPLVATLAAGGAASALRAGQQLVRARAGGSERVSFAANLLVGGIVGFYLLAAAVTNLRSAVISPAARSHSVTGLTVFESMQLVSRYTEPNALVLADMNPLAFDAYQWGSQRRQIVPDMQALLGRQPIPPRVQMLHVDRCPDLLAKLIAQGNHVYLVGVPANVSAYAPTTNAILQPVASGAGAVDDPTVTLYKVELVSLADGALGPGCG